MATLNRVLPVPTQMVSDDDRKRRAFTNQSGQMVPFTYNDLMAQPGPAGGSSAGIELPSEDEVKATTERTQEALQKLVNSKISASLPVRKAELPGPAQFIKYTPAQQGMAYNAGAKQRIIRMVDVQKDPMEPPKFNVTRKIPRGPPSPPAPVIHSPSRKVTAKEQQDWKIPPCISNWKNNKGYVIPLDKRMAADGRGLEDVHINENFAKLAESLFIADRKAREAVEKRAQYEKKLALKEKERQEEKLRQLARQAREERDQNKAEVMVSESGATQRDAQERDEFRKVRREERQRERNIARANPEKQARLRREAERDVSEQIALGRPTGRDQSNTDSIFDQRLFNQSKGIDSGFKDDDVYDVYSKPWKEDNQLHQHIYRPKSNVDQDMYGDSLETLAKNTSRFRPDKDFEGTDRTVTRDGPVQFEKADDDPFGLKDFFAKVREGGDAGGSGGGSRGGGEKRSAKDSGQSSSSKKKSRKE